MPIEIRELVIKAEVSPDSSSAGAPGAGEAAATGGSNATEAMIALCVEKVLQALKEKNER